MVQLFHTAAQRTIFRRLVLSISPLSFSSFCWIKLSQVPSRPFLQTMSSKAWIVDENKNRIRQCQEPVLNGSFSLFLIPNFLRFLKYIGRWKRRGPDNRWRRAPNCFLVFVRILLMVMTSVPTFRQRNYGDSICVRKTRKIKKNTWYNNRMEQCEANRA